MPALTRVFLLTPLSALLAFGWGSGKKTDTNGASEAPKIEPRPDWLSGQSSAYPKSAYLLGIGAGFDQEKAADKARAGIAKSFSLSIAARTSASARETSDGSASSSWQDVSDDVRSSTAKVLDGVEIAQYWRDEQGVFHALAVLNRAHSLSVLKDKLDEIDRDFKDLSAELSQAEGKFARLKSALKLVRQARARKRINADYRILNPEGKGLGVGEDYGSVIADARKAVSALSVQVAASGELADRIRTRIIDGLETFGLRATEGGSKAPDIVVEAKTEGQVLPPDNLIWYWAKGSIIVKLSYGSTGDVFSRFEESGHEASRDPDSALEKTLIALADKTAGHVYHVILNADLSDD